MLTSYLVLVYILIILYMYIATGQGHTTPCVHTVQVKKNPHFLFFSMINCLFFWEKQGETVENFSRFLQEIQYFLQEIPVFLPEILGL